MRDAIIPSLGTIAQSAFLESRPSTIQDKMSAETVSVSSIGLCSTSVMMPGKSVK